jgi:hypothetical protein
VAGIRNLLTAIPSGKDSRPHKEKFTKLFPMKNDELKNN